VAFVPFFEAARLGEARELKIAGTDAVSRRYANVTAF
jgi:hypothetical protein